MEPELMWFFAHYWIALEYSLRPKKQVILGILGQINKKVKMTMFAPIYYPYLALIDSYMRMHFLNRIRWHVFWDKIWILE